MNHLLDTIRAAAAPLGLNLIAAIPLARYDAVAKPEVRAARHHPAARSAVVLANGGGAFWRAYSAFADANPRWRQRQHPLDDFSRFAIERDIATPLRITGAQCEAVFPFAGEGARLDFVTLGKVAGLGGPSLVGVLVNPEYGPWMAFRGALLLEDELDAPGSALGFDPCPTCIVRSCIPACPVAAVRFPAGWDVYKCLEHRVEVEPDCAPRCHARAGCVLGPQHRYPDDELAYHQMRALQAMKPYYEAHASHKRP